MVSRIANAGKPQNTQRAQAIPDRLEAAIDELHAYCDRTGREVLTAKRFADRLADGSLRTQEAVEITLKLLKAQDAGDAVGATADEIQEGLAAKRQLAGLKRSLTCAAKREDADRVTISELRAGINELRTAARHDAKRIERLEAALAERPAAGDSEHLAELERCNERLAAATTRAHAAEKILDRLELDIKAQRSIRSSEVASTRKAKAALPGASSPEPRSTAAAKSKRTTRTRRPHTPDRTGSVKSCSQCGDEKDHADFYKQTKSRDGRMAMCRDCYNARYTISAATKR